MILMGFQFSQCVGGDHDLKAVIALGGQDASREATPEEDAADPDVGVEDDGQIRGYQAPSSPAGYSACKMASTSASLTVFGSRPWRRK